jgi:arginyl-tRNA--protein-N-Asp/Glu arginylyltransferase
MARAASAHSLEREPERMKLLFSEHKSDYGHYIFPYAVWAIPEEGETAGDIFSQGFLPSSREMDRFYLCRNVRVDLRHYEPSSENRRILRKGEDIQATLVPRGKFDYNEQRREFCRAYADFKFGRNIMTRERLDALFNGKITSHLLVFTDLKTGKEVGMVTLFVEGDRLAYYYYAFYDVSYHSRNLGMFMMTSAVSFFKERGCQYLHLGSCYSPNALYKTQFAGVEFFNGVRWSDDMDELKYLIKRDSCEVSQHLLESEDYRQLFYGGDLSQAVEASQFQVRPK